MITTTYGESMSEAVVSIGGIPSLEELDTGSVRLAVVLRLLRAAGWDVFDVSQVVPDHPAGKGRADFALVAAPSRGANGPVAPRALVDVKPSGENLDNGRHERRMVAGCAGAGAPLGVLTNGRRWLLLFQSADLPGGGGRFCELDLTLDPDVAATELNRYLSRDRVASGQAARSAERALRDRTRETANRQAVLNGWRRVVPGLDSGLLELVATAAEQRTGYRPDIAAVRRVLRDEQGRPASAGLRPWGAAWRWGRRPANQAGLFHPAIGDTGGVFLVGPADRRLPGDAPAASHGLREGT